jgi:F-type H+-transporting ATPase subunit b
MVDLILLAEAAHDAAEGHAEATAFGLAPPWWVALSMIALIGLMIYMKVPALVAGMLDKKIDGIREMLGEAAALRAEAEALRKEYADKVANVERDAAAMLEHARKEADAIVAKAKTDSANVISRREKIAEEKIAAAERAAIVELRVRAANAASAAARDLIRTKHSAEADKALVDEAISQL